MSDLRNTNQWEAVTAPIQNAPGKRAASELRRVLAQFDVVNNPRYAAKRDKTGDIEATWCNILAWDATRALGCEVPHWIPDSSLPTGKRELNVNSMIGWMEITGPSAGWKSITAADAGKRASSGYPTIVLWKNPNGGHGHVAVLLPSVGDEIRIAQAGAHNYFDVPLAKGFPEKCRPLKFFTHD